MKKKTIIYILLASLLLGFITSCDENTNDTTNVDPNPQIEPKKEIDDKIEDNAFSKKAFDELSKSLTAITYEDFLTNGKKSVLNYLSGLKYSYDSSYITLDLLDGEFIDKRILIGDSDVYQEYKFDKWVTITESKLINGEFKEIYHLTYHSESSISKEEYTYDEKGNMLLIEGYNLSNDDWLLSCKIEYAYDENGEFLTKTHYEFYDNRVYNTYIYDSNDELIKRIETIYSYGVKKYNNIYNGLNLRDKECIISYAKNGSFSSKEEYAYDGKGNVLSSINSIYKNNAWVYDYKNEYTYDEKGKKISETYSKFRENTWLDNYKHEYTYDEDGHTFTNIYLEYEGNEWVYKNKHEYLRDSNDKIITETYSKYKDNEWSYVGKGEYTYDEYGQKIAEIYSRYINNEWIRINESKWINGLRKELLKISFNPDDTFNTKEEYTYDESGNLLKTSHYIYEDGKWIEQ